MTTRSLRPAFFALLATGLLTTACNPTVQVKAPEDPIVINMNIRIEQEVRVRIEEQARDDIAKNPNIF